MVFAGENVFSKTENKFSETENIFTETGNTFSEAGNTFSETESIFSVIEIAVPTTNTMVFPVETIARGTRARFSDAEPVCSASETGFSVREETAGGVPAELVLSTQRII